MGGEGTPNSDWNLRVSGLAVKDTHKLDKTTRRDMDEVTGVGGCRGRGEGSDSHQDPERVALG